MPFKSKAQQRFMFAAESRGELPKGTAERWAHHTKSIKSLPEHVKKKKGHKKKSADEEAFEKQAMTAAFILHCAHQGITSPDAVAQAAEKFATDMEARAKSALAGDLAHNVGSLLGGLTTTAAIGTGVIPLTLGFAGGAGVGGLKNQMDIDDAAVMRMAAEANAYRRRAAAAKTHAQVRKLLASNPTKYVPIG